MRQGCPLSPYLTIIAVELLAQKIIPSHVIRGPRIFSQEIKILKYADDTTIYLDSSPVSVQEIFRMLDDFGNASGLKVNFDKTILFPLGPFTHSKPYFLEDLPIIWSNWPVTLLGFTFTCNREDLFRLNFPPKLTVLKRVLSL